MIRNDLILIILISLISCNSRKDYTLKEIDDNTNIFYKSNNDINDSIAEKFFNKGLEVVQEKDFVFADSLFHLADKLEPDNVIILNAIALNSYNLKNVSKAYELFDKAILIDKSFSPTYSNYAYCLNKEKDYNKAIDLLEKGIKYVDTDRKRAVFYYTLSISYIRLDNCELALQNIDKAIRLENDKTLLTDYKKIKKYIIDKCKK